MFYEGSSFHVALLPLVRMPSSADPDMEVVTWDRLQIGCKGV